jgi:hypothetical protein
MFVWVLLKEDRQPALVKAAYANNKLISIFVGFNVGFSV